MKKLLSFIPVSFLRTTKPLFKHLLTILCVVLFSISGFAVTNPAIYTVTVTEGGRTTEKISDAVIRALSGFSSATNDSAYVTVIIPNGYNVNSGANKQTFTNTGNVPYLNKLIITGDGSYPSYVTQQFDVFPALTSLKVFKLSGLVLKGVADGTAPANTLISTPGSATVDSIIIDNCKINNYSFVINNGTGTTTIKYLNITNSIVSNIGSTFINEGAATNYFYKILIDRCTVYGGPSTTYNFMSIGLATTLSKFTISNSTLDNIYLTTSSVKYFMDYRTANANLIMTNVILGKTGGTTGSIPNGIRLGGTGATSTFTNCYKTSDWGLTGYNPSNFSSVTAYGSPASSLFVKEGTVNGSYFNNDANLTIKDVTFPGKVSCGDPRWYYPETVNITGGSMVNLNYNLGSGPSTAQTFTMNTIVLRGAVTLTAPADYEISSTGATSGFTNSLTLGSLGNDLTNQTIWVRLKTGLAVGAYNESIAVSTALATYTPITCSGAVTNALPVLDAPSGLSSSSVTYTGFHASWSPVANATGYSLRILLNGSTALIIPVSTGTSYDVTGLTPGGNYTFAVTSIGDAVNYNNSMESSQSGSVSTPFIYLFISLNTAGAGTITKYPSSASYAPNTSVQLTATKNFGYQFVNWVDSISGTVLSSSNQYTVTMDGTKHIQAVFNTLNTYSLTLNTTGGGQPYMVSVTPAGTVVNGQTMYEGGTNVTLTASNNKILTFTNWLTGETNSTLSVPMTQNQNITAVYSAVDYIVGWDFYKAGGSNRPADFYSTSDNSATTLILLKADGTTSGWLDKSTVAANGYYGPGAAVNWQPLVNQLYYQTSFVATNFTDISVTAGMLYNYNAYSVQKCDYSLDGTNFTTLGTYTMAAGQIWYNNTFALPAACNHASKVYIRWIPDYTSAIVGTSSSNDGTSISNIYVTATAAIYNDGIAPILASTVPADGSTNASTTGKVVLTFNKKLMLTPGTVVATLNGKQIIPAISGMTITFPYTGLDYSTQYTFTLPSNSISDLAGNILTTPVTISFTTMTRPQVTKKPYDFIVGVNGDFKAAIQAATTASSTGDRFRIFFPNGQYNIGASTGDANQMSMITLPNVSLIGQSADGVVLYNQNTTEGIGTTATIYFTNTANNQYLQDLTLKNNDYRSGNPSIGRCAALMDQGTKNIYKNVNVLSNQDTYYSGSGREYFEGGSIHGTVDFMCGGGDVFFNETLIYLENRSGNCCTAPSTTTNWGYVFSGCTIDGFAINNGSYVLGRPWQNSPKSIYINTIMNVLPTAAGWTEMGVVPGLFAEYNSVTPTGTAVDISLRKKSFTYNGVTTPVNPYLTSDQAAQYTISNVLGGTDAWQPQLYTDQATSPAVMGNGSLISWNDDNYVLCWVVFKDGVYVTTTTTNSYAIPSTITNGTYTVCAANEMGGLSAVSNSYVYSSVTTGIDAANGLGLSTIISKNANNQITITRNHAVGEGTVTVCNALGQHLVSCSTTGTVTILYKSFLPGIYLVTVNADGGKITKKVIVN